MARVAGHEPGFDAVWVDRASGEEMRRVPQRARVAWFVLGPAAACETEPAAELAVPGGVRIDTSRPRAGSR